MNLQQTKEVLENKFKQKNAKYFTYWLATYNDYTKDDAGNYKLINMIKEIAFNIYSKFKKFDRNSIMNIFKENLHVDTYGSWPNDYGKPFSCNFKEKF